MAAVGSGGAVHAVEGYERAFHGLFGVLVGYAWSECGGHGLFHQGYVVGEFAACLYVKGLRVGVVAFPGNFECVCGFVVNVVDVEGVHAAGGGGHLLAVELHGSAFETYAGV